MHKVWEQIYLIGLIPHLAPVTPVQAVQAAKALAAGGIPCAEVTAGSEQWLEGIRGITKELPGFIVGATAVTSKEQADKAVAAGAEFITGCRSYGDIPAAFDCVSEADVEYASRRGYEAVRIISAEPDALNEMLAAVDNFPGLKAMVAVCADENRIAGVIRTSKLIGKRNIIACCGSWLVPDDLLRAGDFPAITALSEQSLLAAMDFSLSHVGINSGSDGKAKETARKLESLFSFSMRDLGKPAVFAGDYVEMMKIVMPYHGRNGHIAIGCANVARASAYLKRRGFQLNNDSAKYDDEGEIFSIFLNEELEGFALHLMQKNYGTNIEGV